MAHADIEKQIARLEAYRVASAKSLIGKGTVPTAEHIAIEQALATALVAREICNKSG
jgi:hypothetical protein